MRLEIRYNNYKLSTYRTFTTDLPKIKSTNPDDLTEKEISFINRVCDFYTCINEIVDSWKLKADNMQCSILRELSERVAFAKQNINQWIDISNVFKNVKMAQVECFEKDSTTLLEVEDSHVEFIILPTKRIGVVIDSKYFVYANKIQIRTLEDHALYELSCEGVLAC